jgi:hypothetical protein
MPILFVVFGIFLLLIVGNVIKVFDTKKRFVIIFFLLAFEVSFFVGGIEFNDIEFNVIHLILYFVLFSLLVNKLNYRVVLVSIICCLLYYLIASTFDVYVYTSLFKCYLVLLVFLSLFFDFDFRINLVFLLLTFMGLLLINVYLEFNRFTFAKLDFLNIFNLIFVYVLLYIMVNSIRGNFIYGKKVSNYTSFADNACCKFECYKYIC